MRILAIALFALLCVSCASTHKQSVTLVDIKEIKPRYMKTEQFKRIGEYLTGVEDPGNRVIVRTDPEQRNGYYFVLVLDENVRHLPEGTVIVGEFYTPKSPSVQEHTFKLPSERPRTKEIFVGLTGEDWPFGEDAIPAAWRFTIKDANGGILGREESYLWSM